MRDYADMVKIHYKYYENPKEYKKHIPKNLVELEKYSDIDSMVFERNNELVIAMRGLQPAISQRDRVIGASIFLEDAYQQSGFDFETATKEKKGFSFIPNKYGQILIKEQEKIDELKKEYPNKKIVLAGHSRGGRKVVDLGEHNKLEYHAFAPAEMNRYGQKLLGFVSGMVMPTGEAFTGNIAKKMLDTLRLQELQAGTSSTAGLMYEIMYEFGDIPEIQKNILLSAIESKDMKTSVQSFMGKMLIPRMSDRTIDMAYGLDPFRSPSKSFDIEMLSNRRGRMRELAEKELKKQGFPADFRLPLVGDAGIQAPDKFEQIKKLQEPILTSLAGKGKEKRKPPTESISNIYRTDTDVVSRNYEATEVVDTRKEAINFQDKIFRYHTIDHFTSDQMFESTTGDKPIEEQPVEQEEQEIMIVEQEPQREIYPNVSRRYEVDNLGLCRKYPNYSPFCKYILR